MTAYNPILVELMEDEAKYKFFIQWENESISESPAIWISAPYSIGSLTIGKRKKPAWTVWFHLINHWEFTLERDALNKVKEIWSSRKEKKGILWLGNGVHKKVFATDTSGVANNP